MAQNDEIQPGTMKVFDHALPTLTQGVYQIEVRQEVNLKRIRGNENEAVKTFGFKQTFNVEGPRFRLGPADIHAVFPPANSTGNFNEALPHVVFRRHTLPWERKFDSQDSAKPWVALLVFHQEELEQKVKLEQIDVAQRPVDEIIPGRPTPVNGILTPTVVKTDLEDTELNAAGENKPQARTIDISKALFLKIAPRLNELALLAHVRQVSTLDKELLGQDEDGLFSVVIANRVPRPGLNTVHLVSLDGYQDFLTGQDTLPADTAKVRLVSLMSWSFTALPARGSFKELTKKLDVSTLRMPVPQSLANFKSGASEANKRNEEDSAAQLLKGALENGYVPLSYDMRQDEHTAAWYRGPLLPVVVNSENRDPFPRAESGLIYDSRTGMFDISNAVAWQIGRLLALSDQRFTSALSDWRLDGQRALDKMIKGARLAEQFEEEVIWGEIGKIESAKNVGNKALALQLTEQLLKDLTDPHVLSKRLAQHALQAFNKMNSTITTKAATVSSAGAAKNTEAKPTTTTLKPPPDPKRRLIGKMATLISQIDLTSVTKTGEDAAKEIRSKILALSKR